MIKLKILKKSVFEKQKNKKNYLQIKENEV